MQDRSTQRTATAVFVLLLLSSLVACGGGSSERSSAGKGKTESEHAPAGVVPGSYEDWCDEHQVPESLCSRCNPGLIPAFKASNDWCAEHGLPESQCLACNPDLKIVRPPKPSGS